MSIDRSPFGSRSWAWRGLMAGVVVSAGVLGWTAAQLSRDAPSPPPSTLRIRWPIPEEAARPVATAHTFGLALSPDGRYVAIASGDEEGSGLLLLHEFSSNTTRELAGTAGGRQPFWAPDATRLGFFAAGELRTVSLDGSPPTTLATAPDPVGGVWGNDGVIVFAPQAGGLMEIAETGGAHRELTKPETESGDTSHRFPQLAREGSVIVLLVTSTDRAREGVWALVRADGQMTRLASSATQALADGDDILVLRDEALVSQRLDARTGRLAGPATFITLPVGRGPNGELFASISGTGLLVTAPPVRHVSTLQWFTRDGQQVRTIGDPGSWSGVRISRDGHDVALVQPEPMLGTLDVWVTGLDDPRPRRLSRSIDVDDHPVWAHDGSRIAWVSARQTIIVRGALGELEERSLWKAAAPIRLSDWTMDGRWWVFSERSAASGDDIWVMPSTGAEPTAYLRTPDDEHSGAVSPDGRWMAYVSNDSGSPEVYVDRFPLRGNGTRTLITDGGGTDPRWRADGRELFVRKGRDIVAVSVRPDGDRIVPSSPTVLLSIDGDIRAWDVTPDGQRVLASVAAAQVRPDALPMFVHWRSLLP